jgi:hypothetical protein
MRGTDVAGVARSPPAAVEYAPLRAMCAATADCASTPSTMIVAGKLIEQLRRTKAEILATADKARDSADFCRSTAGWRLPYYRTLTLA